MENNGWIKIHRKLWDNPIVRKDNDHLAVWIYLLLNVTRKDYPAFFNGEKITLMPGQIITNRKTIAAECGVSESKAQRILSCFEIDHQIEQQTCRHNRLISVVNWDLYQVGEQQNEQLMNNYRTTNEQLMNTKQEIKNKRNKEYINRVGQKRPGIEQRVYDFGELEKRLLTK